MYIKSTEGAESPSELRDCTVRALANAALMPYEAAHKLLKRFGREDRRGCRASTFHEAYEAASLAFVGVYGTSLTAKFISHRYSLPLIKGLSLQRLLPTISKGRYIVIVTGHAFAVVDGAIVDKGTNNSKKRIVALYKCKENLLQLGYKAQSVLN